MFKSGKQLSALTSRIREKKLWVGGLVVALAIPLTVLPGLERSEPTSAGAQPNGEDKQVAGGSGYQVRCWQLGQLIFEENNLRIPEASLKLGLKLNGSGQRPVYLIETTNSTCLIKPSDVKE